MKIYLIVTFMMSIVSGCYGLLVPSLISSKDSVGVFIGFSIAFIGAPCALYLVGKYLYVNHIKKGEDK